MWELLGGLLVGCIVSGFVPIVNAEVLVIAAGAALGTVAVPLIAAVSTIGQVGAKTLLFALARRAPSRLPRRARRAVEHVSASMRTRLGAAWSMVFASAAIGLPPFYGVSLASGALGVRTACFVSAGTMGRLIRFGALAWIAAKVGG